MQKITTKKDVKNALHMLAPNSSYTWRSAQDRIVMTRHDNEFSVRLNGYNHLEGMNFTAAVHALWTYRKGFNDFKFVSNNRDESLFGHVTDDLAIGVSANGSSGKLYIAKGRCQTPFVALDSTTKTRPVPVETHDDHFAVDMKALEANVVYEYTGRATRRVDGQNHIKGYVIRRGDWLFRFDSATAALARANAAA